MNFENILGNRYGKGLHGTCDGINHLYGVNDSNVKQISKTFVEIAICCGIRQNIQKQVTTQEMCKTRNVN